MKKQQNKRLLNTFLILMIGILMFSCNVNSNPALSYGMIFSVLIIVFLRMFIYYFEEGENEINDYYEKMEEYYEKDT